MSPSTWARPILEHVIRASWDATLLAALLLLLFWLTRERIAARWRYRLWLLLVLRLLLPVVPSSRLSVHNLWASQAPPAIVVVPAPSPSPVRAHRARPGPAFLTEEELAAISSPSQPTARPTASPTPTLAPRAVP